MKVLLYTEGLKTIGKSGLGKAVKHQINALERNNVEYTLDPKEIKNVDIVLKADMHGSIEAIKHSIGKLTNDEVTVSVIHSGIGEITENDIILAKASKAIVIGFNVRANSKVRTKAKTESVEISYY